MQAVFETIFDMAYLVTVICAGLKLIKSAGKSKQFRLCGIMALVLGGGDAFHLLPRIIALNTSGTAAYPAALGSGKLITSLTMTVFYLLLYYVWRERYQIKQQRGLTYFVLFLAALRVLLVLLPQNEWLSANPPLIWGIYRNIPFTLLGLLLLVLFYRSARQQKDADFRYLWLTIALSFAFYLPVVVAFGTFPAIGILMVPKTCAYMWLVQIAYKSWKKERKEVLL